MTRRFPLAALIGVASTLVGCVQPLPTGTLTQARFAIARHDTLVAAPDMGASGRVAQAWMATEAAPLPAAAPVAPPAPSAAPAQRGGSGGGARPAPAAPAPEADPHSSEARPAPTGVATIRGRLDAADLSVAYYSRGREAYCGTRSGVDGAFTLEVPVDGMENGVLVVREPGSSGKLGLARVRVQAGQPLVAPEIGLMSPEAAVMAPLDTPDGLTALEHAVWAAEAGPWHVPLWSSDEPERPVPAYVVPGFTLVTGRLALAADLSRGSLTSGPADALPAFLAPPDLGGLPGGIAPGAPLSWPAVAGATRYTMRLYRGTDATPVWEAAVNRPTVSVPSELVVPDTPLSLEVVAWDAPRARHSWAVRQFGAPLKP